MTNLELLRKNFYQDSIGSFDDDEYRKRIECHYGTLKKYIDKFGVVLSAYIGYGIINRLSVYFRIGKKRTLGIINGEIEVSINDIYRLFSRLNLKSDFKTYVVNKTNFSYSVNSSAIIPIYLRQKRYDICYRNKIRFAEFVYLILAEYTILHNYMVNAKKRPSGVKTIDSWIEEL